MDLQGRCYTTFLILWCFSFALSSAYKNFTVGDESGWVYPVLHSNVDYSKWASGKGFSLGDYLIFNYPDKNHSVIVTQNHTVYSSCDYEDSNDNDIQSYGEPGTSTYSEVPLLETGATYFFCGTYNGEHCRGGMRFAINVTHGEGLPPNLISSPPVTEGSPEEAPSDNSSSPPEGEEPSPSLTLPSTTDTNSNTDSNMASSIQPSVLKTIFIMMLLLFSVLQALL